MKISLPLRFTSIVISLFFVSTLSAQVIQGEFTIGGTGNDEGNSMVQTKDGGYAIAGFTTSYGVGNFNIYVIKLNSKDSVIWTKTIGGTGYEEGSSIVQTTDGGYAIAGYSDSFGAGGFDVYAVKLDSLGNISWTKTIGGSNYEYGYSIVQTRDGGYAIAGSTTSFGVTKESAYVIKLDALDNIIWTKTIASETSAIQGYSIIQAKDGGYAITGTIDSSNNKVYVAKLDSTGALLWSKTIGGSGTSAGRAIVQTNDDGYAIGGFSNSYTNNIENVYVVKMDSLGNVTWTETIGSKSYYATGYSLVQTSDGGYAIAGETELPDGSNYSVYVVKLDITGNLKWTKTLGGDGTSAGNSIVQTTDGGFAIAGITNSYGAGGYDVFVIKTDSLGNTCDTTYTGGTVTTIDSGNIIIPGYYTLTDSGYVSNGGTLDTGGIYNSICSVLATGVNVVKSISNNIIIYPNPSTGLFTLNMTDVNEQTEIDIYNILGEKIYSAPIYLNSNQLNLENEPQGMYLYRVLEKNGTLFAEGKLIIER